MAETLSSASTYHPASTRLLVALILLALFAAVSPRRTARPLPRAVISVIVAGWLFGATLIWGTPWASKMRWATDLNTWQDTALLALAALGALAAGGALRSFAYQRQRPGWMLTALFAISFAGWSSVVRYSVGVAALVLAAGAAALAFASTSPPRSTATSPEQASKSSSPRLPVGWLGIAASALPLLSGLALYWWLKLGPKTGLDLRCDLPVGGLLTFIPFVSFPGLSAWIRTRTSGKSREAAAAAVVVTAAVTIGACILAFLIWFGVNECGE